jgi:hypothetical protein
MTMKIWSSACLLAVLVSVGGPAVAVPAPGPSGEELAAPAVAAPQGSARGAGGHCRDTGGQFDPTGISIPGVVGPSRVLGLGRDGGGVPMPPPLTEQGKWEFAWDRLSHIRPGSEHGVVRLSAHTYPRDGSYGLALGNRLLSQLRVGSRLVATGQAGQQLCYTVQKRVRVRADRPLPAYYDSQGRARLAIVVCSGVRRGPGDWSQRTVWFAVPSARQR